MALIKLLFSLFFCFSIPTNTVISNSQTEQKPKKTNTVEDQETFMSDRTFSFNGHSNKYTVYGTG
jgi:hypothetical protein